MRTNDRLEQIVYDISNLKLLINRALEMANKTSTQLAPNGSAMAQQENLKELTRQARRFHSAASTTASTIYQPSGNRFSIGASTNFDTSDVGYMSESRRQNIKHWNIAVAEEEIENGHTAPPTTAHSDHSYVCFSDTQALNPTLVFLDTLPPPTTGSHKPSVQPGRYMSRWHKTFSWFLITLTFIFRLMELIIAAFAAGVIGSDIDLQFHQSSQTSELTTSANTHGSLLYTEVTAGMSMFLVLFWIAPTVRYLTRWPADLVLSICWLVSIILLATNEFCEYVWCKFMARLISVCI
jgi:hypothetical protein